MVCAPVRRDNPSGIISPYRRTNHLYLTCTMVSSVDLAHYGVSRAKDWVSVDSGTFLQYFFVVVLIITIRMLTV